MARGILIQTPSDDDVVIPDTSFSFTVTGYVAPADTPVEVTLYHGVLQKLGPFPATIDTSDHHKWTLAVTVNDDGDYVLIATQAGATLKNIVHSVSFNVTRPAS